MCILTTLNRFPCFPTVLAQYIHFCETNQKQRKIINKNAFCTYKISLTYQLKINREKYVRINFNFLATLCHQSASLALKKNRFSYDNKVLVSFLFASLNIKWIKMIADVQSFVSLFLYLLHMHQWIFVSNKTFAFIVKSLKSW